MFATESTKLVIEPGTLRLISERQTHACRTFTFDKSANVYTDRSLLAYCDYTPMFGGSVDRRGDQVIVHVYTD